ncbi:MAG: DNRLRE domain-containing protein, partial [Planctomycetaceae bacterium]
MYAQDTGTASGYINDLQELRSFLAPDTANQPLPLALTEYNVRTASSYDGRVETLDSPSDYAALGANSVALADQDVREFHLFKFAQTERTGGTYPVTKNGTHYVSNGTASPNNYGGATKAAEVYRLFNKAAAPGRDRLAFTSDAGTDVRTLVTLDPASKTCFAFITNNSSVAVPLELDLTALGIPAGNAAIIEEVSENFSGGVSRVAAVSAGKVPTGTLPPQTVWLVSIPTQAQTATTVTATADTVIGDGVSRNTQGGSATSLLVRSDGTIDGRRATLLKFPTSSLNPTSLQRVLLSLNVGAAGQAASVQAHLYGLQDDAWTEATVWSGLSSALRQDAPAGNQISSNTITAQGTTTRILAQITANASAAERQFDVTEFVRSQSDGFASFLIVQDHRWDVALPSLSAGDTQPDGLRISSRETASGPQLKVFGNNGCAARIFSALPVSTVISAHRVRSSPGSPQATDACGAKLALAWC